MAVDLGSARLWAEALIRQQLRPGMKAIDATMGNGADTALLAELVGEQGQVWAFDVQRQALEQTENRLKEAGFSERVQLVLDGHQHMEKYVDGPVDLVCFNLGWLPGGDKAVTTRVETTRTALEAALRLLKKKGLLTVCIYPGHEEGQREKAAVLDWAATLTAEKYQSRLTAYQNQVASAPVMLAVQRMK